MVQVAPNGAVVELAQYDTQDGLYDCAWSEANENVLVASSGDGSIKVRGGKGWGHLLVTHITRRLHRMQVPSAKCGW